MKFPQFWTNGLSFGYNATHPLHSEFLSMRSFRSLATRALVAAAVIGLGAAAMPAPAQAWWHGGWHGGWGFGGVVIGVPPVVLAPPAVVVAPPAVVVAPPPPVYYAAPPVAYYAPAPAVVATPAPAVAVTAAPTYASASGQSCYAGAYVCPLEHATPIGANCSCPANEGRVHGQVR
jgi:hypothetical protein